MGGRSSTRRIVVEDNNGADIVKVSAAVVERWKEGAEPKDAGRSFSSSSTSSSSTSSSTSPSTAPLKQDASDRVSEMLNRDIDDFYVEKLRDLQARHEALQKLTNEQFTSAVKEVEEKFIKVTGSAVCQELQNKVLECYKANPAEPLNCSKVVSAFTSCVDRARMTASLSRVETAR